MGSLKTFDLDKYIDKYNLTMYYESGVSTGESFRYARKFKFKKYFGSELLPEYGLPLVDEFQYDPAVEIFVGDSVECLKKLLKDYPGENFLFWLDAHYPNHYSQDYSNISIEQMLPLKRELDSIYAHGGNNVIIIDDLRIYENGPYSNGALPDDTPGDNSGIEVPGNFKFEKLLSDEGYLIIYPS